MPDALRTFAHIQMSANDREWSASHARIHSQGGMGGMSARAYSILNARTLTCQRDRRGMVWAHVADAESPIFSVKLNEISAEYNAELSFACSVACFGKA